jgi:hypothetical protein
MSFGCFDLSGFLALSSSQALLYRQQWDTYNRIQTFNSNVSTIRAQGNRGISYYTYINFDEKDAFTNGQYLHQKRYPNSNWNAVPQD